MLVRHLVRVLVVVSLISAIACSRDPETVENDEGFQRIPHTISVDGAQLEAELLVPDGGREVKSAMVFVGGSSPTEFSDYGGGFIDFFLMDTFLQRDIAILLYNKRGVGDSSGNWKKGSIESRAADTLEVVDYLRGLDIVNPKEIGVVGHSQGGWIVQLIASQDSELAYAISMAGPTVTVLEQVMFFEEHYYRWEGYEGRKLERRLEKKEKANEWMLANGDWFPFFGIGHARNLYAYSPNDALLDISQPILLMYGEFDIMAPAEPSRERLEELYPAGVPGNFSFYVAGDSNHSFREAEDIYDGFSGETRPFQEFVKNDTAVWLDGVLGSRGDDK
jgi:pimeloyl-ACP methyl ester carboxylesterase